MLFSRYVSHALAQKHRLLSLVITFSTLTVVFGPTLVNDQRYLPTSDRRLAIEISLSLPGKGDADAIKTAASAETTNISSVMNAQVDPFIKHTTTTASASLTKSDDDGEISNFSDNKVLAKRFNERRQLVSDECERSLGRHPNEKHSLNNQTSKQSYLNFILVNDERKILFCSVPKVASTAWRRFFVRLENNGSDLKMGHESFHLIDKMLPYLKPIAHNSNESLTSLIEKTKGYTKVMWVRDPLKRLYSAWRSKFAVKSRYYWGRFGTYIVYNFRSYEGMEWKKPIGSLISFKEFIRFIAHPTKFIDDAHWTEMHRICLPCFIDYDYIGHLEGGQEEFDYVVEKMTGQRNITMTQEDDPMPKNIGNPEEAFNDIPNYLIVSLYQKYAEDHRYFGYEIPDYAKIRISNRRPH